MKSFSLFVVTFALLGCSVAMAQDVGEEAPAVAVTDLPAEITAPAAQVAADPFGTVQTIVSASKAGNWRLVASLCLAVLMLALGKVRSQIKWFSGDRGGAVLVMSLALMGGLASALATDAKLDFNLLLGSLGICWTAVGGYSWMRRLLWPAKSKK